MERTLFGPRTELALAYARENGVNRVEGARDAWLGIAAAGKTYYDLRARPARARPRRASALERAGIRILKLGMVWPLEPQIAREFARGLDEIVVVGGEGPVRRDAAARSRSTAWRTRRASSASTTTAASRCCRASWTSTPT